MSTNCGLRSIFHHSTTCTLAIQSSFVHYSTTTKRLCEFRRFKKLSPSISTRTCIHDKSYQRRTPRQLLLEVNPSYEVNDKDQWDAGDLQSDMVKLKLAVAESNAETDLSQKERLHLLEEFARQKREFIPDLKKYVIRPFTLSAILIGMQCLSSSLGKKGKYQVLGVLITTFSQLFLTSMNIFYVISIILPILFYHLIPSRIQSKDETMMQSEYEFQKDESDLCKDNGDYSRCLLENWASCIYPSVFFHLLGLFAPWICRNQAISFPVISQYYIIALGMSLSRCITRLGAAASLHQFPKLLYDLRRSNQPRPIALIPTILNMMIDLYLYMLPLGFSADVAQSFWLFFSKNEYRRMDNLLSIEKGIYLERIMVPVLLLSTLVPLLHVFAFTRIVKIGHFLNVSLAMDQDKALELLEKQESNGLKLRYKLQWRPPLRLLDSTRQLFRKFILYIFTGWGEKASIIDSTVRLTQNKPYVLTLIEKEVQENGERNFSPRSTWIKNASARMAKIHQMNYMSKTFDVSLYHDTHKCILTPESSILFILTLKL